jgi:hypothetical protein
MSKQLLAGFIVCGVALVGLGLASVLLVAPAVLPFVALCLLGVWKSHGGIGPRGGAK